MLTIFIMILMLPFQGFSIIDADKDGKISTAELKSMDNDDWNTVAAIFEVNSVKIANCSYWGYRLRVSCSAISLIFIVKYSSVSNSN